jgi:cytochrome c5
MGEQHHDFPKTTTLQVILAILGASIAPALVVFLVVKLVLSIQATQIETGDDPAEAIKIVERIRPVAMVDVAEAGSGPRVEKGGEEVYNAVCLACHGSGAMGAPKFGDKAVWAPRIAQGYETLVKHAIKGIRMMPPRGGGADLSDVEVANAVVYMANEAGADFTLLAPAAANEAAAQPQAEAASENAAAAPAKSAAAGKSGEEVTQSVCMMCHGSGMMGAPKIGDKAAWAPRIAQGYDALVQNAIKGIRMMPAKGGNPALSDAEVEAAVAHMANQSGASFKTP